MATRKIIDAKQNGEKVWLKGHAKAIYMSDGSTVEDAINGMTGGSGGTVDTSNLVTKQELAQKQDIITDLETIRQGAAKGATALQEHQSLEGYTKDIDLANVAKSGSYNDLKNKPTIPSAVTESTVSGWGFTKNTGTYIKPSTGIPKTDLESAVQTSLGKADTALQSYTEKYKGTVTGVKVNGTTKNPSNGVVDLGTVITEHQDISNKQDTLVSGTNIKTINGESILGSGDISISGGTNLTENDDITVRDINARDISAESLYGRVYTDEIWDQNGRRELVITNDGILIKDDTGNSTILQTITSGDGTKFLADDGTYKTISGGGSSSGNGAYSEVNHGTSDTTFTLTPNTFHIWGEVTTLNLDFGTETEGIANEYLFQFTSGSTATTLSLPDNIKWTNEPNIETKKIYQISILNGLGSILEFSV